MIKKIAPKVERILGKYPKTQPKAKPHAPKEANDVIPKKARKKHSWYNKRRTNLERTPKEDTFEPSKSQKGTKPSLRRPSATMNLGDFVVWRNKQLAEKYKDDLEKIAQIIPEVTFFRAANETSAKEMKSILAKIEKRSEQFLERGYRGVVRDSVRARIFMPDADKNYGKIIDEMKKMKYKVALNYVDDAAGNAIKNSDGTFKMAEDIDVRFGKNAKKSGYEDVQIRFQKDDVLYELIILPGPNYMNAANKEHDVFENIKKYTNYNLDKDMGAKQIIAAIEETFASFSRRLYAEALVRDKGGAKKITESTTFTPEEVKDINALFKSLKNLFLGKFNALPPSKRLKPAFKDTKTYANLHLLETNLRKFIDLYKPVTPQS